MNGVTGDAQALEAIVADRSMTDGDHGDRKGGPYPIGTIGILVTVGMLFAAFTTALLMRRTGTDWTPIALPAIVWPNTVLLLGSSIAVELARAGVRRGSGDRAALWLAIASALGVLFLAGQIAAWRMLAARGVLLPTGAHAAFFYMLSGIHAAHVLGGLGALVWTLRRTQRGVYTRASHRGIDHAAIYWHFVGGVWIYLLVLLTTL